MDRDRWCRYVSPGALGFGVDFYWDAHLFAAPLGAHVPKTLRGGAREARHGARGPPELNVKRKGAQKEFSLAARRWGGESWGKRPS